MNINEVKVAASLFRFILEVGELRNAVNLFHICFFAADLGSEMR